MCAAQHPEAGTDDETAAEGADGYPQHSSCKKSCQLLVIIIMLPIKP
jgi:hypothetical protein